MKYKDYPLKELVALFLKQHRESDMWDVKQEWHTNTQDLVKDIICFANTVHDEDCYLIFGITDELKVLGVQGKRYKQSDILDTLSNLHFAGDNVPEIELCTIDYQSDFVYDEKVEIDILIIKNTYITPIYLKKPYGEMLQGCIYSRVGDKNTPNKGNTETKQIELLWRKRFGLTKPPLEYIIDRLCNKLEWKEYDEAWYNIYKPEYVIRINYNEDDDRYSDEFYSYSQVNESTTFQMLDIIANNTVLAQYQTVCLDSGRLLVPVPEYGFLDIDNPYHNKYSYKYYIEDSDRYRILSFLYDSDNFEAYHAFNDLLKVVLLFRTTFEKEDFEQYVANYYSKFIQRVEQCNNYDYIDTGEERKTDFYKLQLRTGVVLNQMLLEYRDLTSNII